MKIKNEFIVHEAEGETMLVPTGMGGFSGMIRGNKTLGAILKLLQDDITEEQLVAIMKQRFDAPEDVIRQDVEKAIAKLREIGAIDG